ncbi:hypothetical protein EBU94_05760, partial [bacterium]|nr:hypothetical protein [bacterium]
QPPSQKPKPKPILLNQKIEEQKNYSPNEIELKNVETELQSLKSQIEEFVVQPIEQKKFKKKQKQSTRDDEFKKHMIQIVNEGEEILKQQKKQTN